VNEGAVALAVFQSLGGNPFVRYRVLASCLLRAAEAAYFGFGGDVAEVCSRGVVVWVGGGGTVPLFACLGGFGGLYACL
jgi:hypothetical protein